jgi:hypothetical protein
MVVAWRCSLSAQLGRGYASAARKYCVVLETSSSVQSGIVVAVATIACKQKLRD